MILYIKYTTSLGLQPDRQVQKAPVFKGRGGRGMNMSHLVYIAWKNTSHDYHETSNIIMILLIEPSQQIVLVLLKHFTLICLLSHSRHLIWTDWITHTLYECKMSKLMDCVCRVIYVKWLINLDRFDMIVSSYQIQLIISK